MPSASDLVIDSNVSMLLKGPFGFAKTCAACTAALEGPVFLAYIDKKQPVELDHFFKIIIKRPEALKNIEYESYSSNNINQYVNKLIEYTKYCDKIAIITDSATNFATAAVNWSLGWRNPAGPKKDKLNKDSVQFVPDFDEYKVETSMITQSLDLLRAIKAHNIWTCHPISSLEVADTGNNTIRVSKVKKIVSYGNKVGEIIPGQFSEIYHFSILNEWNPQLGKATQRRLVTPLGVGDDFAKSNLGLTEEMDITNKPFWLVWREAMKKLKEANP
jgi:archaellum biogenesis ATPase FlaH